MYRNKIFLAFYRNETKVTFFVIGTEDAYGKMFHNLRTLRRVGDIISSNAYTENIKYYTLIMKELFCYQWFDKKQTLTEEIIKEFYTLSKGFIFMTVSLYMYVQQEYLESKKHFDLTPDFIRKTANHHFKGIQPLLATKNNENSILPVLNTKKHIINNQTDIDDIISVQAEQSNKITMIDLVSTDIQNKHGDKYSHYEIQEICKAILLINPQVSVDQLVQLTEERLSKAKKGKKIKKTNITRKELQLKLGTE